MTRLKKVTTFAICVVASVAQGWIVLKVYSVGAWLLYFGIVGAIPFLLLNGVHGDAEGAAGVAGGILYVITNGAVYYGVIRLFLRLYQRRKQKRSTSLG